jgi:hypothetical protein
MTEVVQRQVKPQQRDKRDAIAFTRVYDMERRKKNF